MERLLGAANPLAVPPTGASSLRTLSRPSSPPQAMYPSALFHAMYCRRVLLGMAIGVNKQVNQWYAFKQTSRPMVYF